MNGKTDSSANRWIEKDKCENSKSYGSEEELLSEILKQIQAQRPLIHCITNIVTVNDCANILHAVGASPVMAHHPLEAAEVTRGSRALVCNMGAITEYEAMEAAALEAHRLGHPIIVDPVGVSGSTYRRGKCEELIAKVRPSCIRGNYSEIGALIKRENTGAGVDAASDGVCAAHCGWTLNELKTYAKSTGAIIIASGATDIITDGTDVFYCEYGDPLMTRITGSGCMLSAMLGAFFAIDASAESAFACCAFFGKAGETAAKKTREIGGGTMTFRLNFIDEIYLGCQDACISQ